MEELLNKLIERGWKPFGIASYCSFDVKEEIKIILGPFGGGEYLLHRTLSLRELVSKESGLWQFVCENGMVKEQYKHERILDPTFGVGWTDCKEQAHDGDYGYRLIESALKDESELESFILDNIKV